MIKILLVILYVYTHEGTPTLKLEQKPYTSAEQCNAEGQKRVQDLQTDPRFVGGLFAGCIQIPVQEASKK